MSPLTPSANKMLIEDGITAVTQENPKDETEAGQESSQKQRNPLLDSRNPGKVILRTIYSPTSNQTYIRIKPHQTVVGLLETGRLVSANRVATETPEEEVKRK
jgi:hypothetical protein